MAGLNSWLSPAVLHALGWALIHSLWQGAAVAAVAALAMAFIRRPAIRYLAGVGALAVMLAAPVATFLVLAKPAAPVPVLRPAAASVLPATPPTSMPVAVFATADRAIAAVADAPRPLPDLLPWLVAAWACGVAFFSLRFAGGFLLLEHRRRTGSHRPGEPVLSLCLDLQRRLGLDRAIQYLECGWVQAPAVIGWLRPAVLLPVFALTGLSEGQFRAVIAHELAHIRRHDWLVNLFQVLVESLLFYHPAMWWLNRRIRIERELCCDEIAVALTGSRLEYARALAQMAEWKNVSMLAMAANRGPLTQRVLHILGRKPGAGQRVAGLTGGMLFLCAALAAANLLFGIAYPVQMAEAKESVKVALVSSQAAVADLARKVVLSAKDAALPSVAPGQMDAAAETKADTLAVPPSDLSRLLPSQTLATPTVVVASNDPLAKQQPLPDASPAAALRDQSGGRPITRDQSAGPAQAPLSPPPSVMAAPMAALSPTVTGTEPALACLLGLSHWLCQDDLFAIRAKRSFPRGVPDCVDERHPNAWPKHPASDSRCPHGVLEAVDYLGRNARGDDVYAVEYSHSITTYALQQPNPDGKVEEYWNVNIPSYVAAVPSQNAHRVALYRRPAEWSDPPDRHAAADQPPQAGTPDDHPVMLASTAAPGQPSAPRTRTEPYLGCYLGFGSWTCPSYLVTPLWWCGEEYAQRHARDCIEGPLEQVDYLGANAAGADVYAVKFRNVDMTYVIAPLGSDGKKGAIWIRRGNPNGLAASSLVAVTSRAGAGLIYKRTATDGGVEADRSDRHATADPPTPAANAIICHSPKLVELSKEVHRGLCVPADILANLKVMGPQLKAAATSPFVQHPFLNDFQKEPPGGPDTIICRGDRALTCAHNSYWAFMDRPQPMGSPELAPYLGSPAQNPAPPTAPP